ncbi:hypothetical protein HK405_004118 [Cladochytrium tenue]|nr:hypothetical protein HK405_004118 [Cladochytrium tenue]
MAVVGGHDPVAAAAAAADIAAANDSPFFPWDATAAAAATRGSRSTHYRHHHAPPPPATDPVVGAHDAQQPPRARIPHPAAAPGLGASPFDHLAGGTAALVVRRAAAVERRATQSTDDGDVNPLAAAAAGSLILSVPRPPSQPRQIQSAARGFGWDAFDHQQEQEQEYQEKQQLQLQRLARELLRCAARAASALELLRGADAAPLDDAAATRSRLLAPSR